MHISPQAREGISKDVQAAQTKEELIQLGAGLLGQLPTDLQKMLREHTDPLIIDVNDISIPWELLHDGKDFLSLRVPLGKQIRTAEIPRLAREKSDEIRILLIGVPVVPNSDLQPLQFVEEEISHLQEAFKTLSGITFDPANDILFDKEAHVWEVQKRLKAGRYKIIHFAGHATYDSKSEQGGILLHDGILETETIKNSVGGNPLIFLNACESAQGRGKFIHTGYLGVYLSGIASAFIIGGAMACVASIWGVLDHKGFQFSIDFYKEITKGAMVGEALRRTKFKEFKKDTVDSRAWVNYVLFGDPTQRIF